MKKYLMFAMVLCCFSSEAFARPRRNYVQSMPHHKTYTTNVISKNDQERCEAEANYMSQNHISGHVWGCIGSFEGVGVGYSPNCNTCTPSNNMTLTGDASAQDNNGRWYRVRSWR